MAKYITLTEDTKAKILTEFSEMIAKAKMSDGKITFTKSFGHVDRKAELIFTETAWIKMTSLVREFDKEIAWHGVAYRGENDSYIITDILVYPQQVTGATVDEDEDRMSEWYMSIDDETFNHMRMQGHSHVNMATSPSPTDTNLYTKFLEQCTERDFYIFLIWNKRGEKTIKIYDFEKNVLFENIDCAVKIIPDGLGFVAFIESAKSMVKDKVYKPLAIVGSTETKEPTKPAGEKKKETTPVKADNKTNTNQKKGKRKGTRPKTNNRSRSYGGGYGNTYMSQTYNYDDYDDPFNNDYEWPDCCGWPD